MIIGVTGPLCAGKDSIAQIFKEKGFVCFSFGDVLRKLMKEKGIKLERKNIREYAKKMREKEGDGFITKLIIAQLNKEDYLVQGFRNIEEIKGFRKFSNFVLIALESLAEIRFERMKSRERENDPKTLEEFKKLDEMELSGVNAEGYGFGIRDCMNEADFVIENNYGLDELNERVSELLESLRKA